MNISKTNTAKVNLQQLVNRLISSYQPLAEKHQSSFKNDVSPGLYIGTDQEILSTLLGTLFYMVARCSKETLITVYATAYEDRVSISISDSSPAGTYAILYEFQHLVLLSKEIGGFLEISNYKNKETTISFNFENSMLTERLIINELKVA